MNRPTRRSYAGLALGGLLLAAGLSGVIATQSATAHPGSDPSARLSGMARHRTDYEASGPVVTIRSYTFYVPTSVTSGARVTIRNKDDVNHTFTSNSGAFGVVVPAKSSRTITAPKKAGSYRFHCKYHAEMVGTLHVR